MGDSPLLIADEFGFVSRGIEARQAKKVAAAPKRRAFDSDKDLVLPTVRRLIALVARQADLSPEAIRGEGRALKLINARFCIANLAEEFCPRLSMRAMDDAMLRSESMCAWYRERHRDRLELFPEYMALHERCRAELLVPVSP